MIDATNLKGISPPNEYFFHAFEANGNRVHHEDYSAKVEKLSNNGRTHSMVGILPQRKSISMLELNEIANCRDFDDALRQVSSHKNVDNKSQSDLEQKSTITTPLIRSLSSTTDLFLSVASAAFQQPSKFVSLGMKRSFSLQRTEQSTPHNMKSTISTQEDEDPYFFSSLEDRSINDDCGNPNHGLKTLQKSNIPKSIPIPIQCKLEPKGLNNEDEDEIWHEASPVEIPFLHHYSNPIQNMESRTMNAKKSSVDKLEDDTSRRFIFQHNKNNNVDSSLLQDKGRTKKSIEQKFKAPSRRGSNAELKLLAQLSSSPIISNNISEFNHQPKISYESNKVLPSKNKSKQNRNTSSQKMRRRVSKDELILLQQLSGNSLQPNKPISYSIPLKTEEQKERRTIFMHAKSPETSDLHQRPIDSNVKKCLENSLQRRNDSKSQSSINRSLPISIPSRQSSTASNQIGKKNPAFFVQKIPSHKETKIQDDQIESAKRNIATERETNVIENLRDFFFGMNEIHDNCLNQNNVDKKKQSKESWPSPVDVKNFDYKVYKKEQQQSISLKRDRERSASLSITTCSSMDNFALLTKADRTISLDSSTIMRKPFRSSMKRTPSFQKSSSSGSFNNFIYEKGSRNDSFKDTESETSQTSKNALKRKVSFSSLKIREYNVALGDNPSCSHGPPISLGWDFRDRKDVQLEEYEKKRTLRRNPRELLLSDNVRRYLIRRAAGHSKQDLLKAMKEIKKVKMQRKITGLFLPASPLDEAFEDVIKAFQGMMGNHEEKSHL